MTKFLFAKFVYSKINLDTQKYVLLTHKILNVIVRTLIEKIN